MNKISAAFRLTALAAPQQQAAEDK